MVKLAQLAYYEALGSFAFSILEMMHILHGVECVGRQRLYCLNEW